MLSEKQNENKFIYNFNIDNYVPEDHLLRYIDKYIDFSFIREKVKHLYSHTGRPSVDPVVLIKMLLIGYLYDIKSERQIENEIKVNLAYRWFISYALDEEIPDHSTISQTRRRKFSESGIFQEIFDEVVKQCKSKGLINGDTIFTDSTHIKANASMDSLSKIVITPKEYFKNLDEEIKKEDGKSETTSIDKAEKKTNETHRSKSDPDARLMNRPGKPKGLHYLEHRSIDKSGYITDTYVTPGNEQDSIPYIDRLLRQRWAFNFKIKNAVADKGYGIGRIYADLTDLGINAYIPKQQEEREREGMFVNSDYKYINDGDYYVCPAGNHLTRRSKEPNQKISFIYSCGSEVCNSDCMNRSKCTRSEVANRAKTLKRNIYQKEIEYQLQKKGDPDWKSHLRKRRYLSEGSFADAKMNHGLTRARYRGLEKVQEQTLLIATVQNIKKMIKELKKVGENISAEVISALNYSLLIFAY
jgi:transposase